ncbi:MAG TPA: hypothetical protein VLZ75_09000 [Chitinophagales bacterium]|nr:hypothetical protein [Chitinophagales bacterium]
MAKSNPTKNQWLVAFYTTLGMLFYWWSIVRDAHLYLFGSSGESIKNYFSSLYYILYDKDQHFTGLNYPYGEHLAYTDAQPLLSLILSPLVNGNYEYAGNIVTIINILLIFSVPIAAMYLFRLFILWKMPSWYSGVMAAAIALLSPQAMQLTGHYTLAYVCFFPMVWYYTANWLQNKKIISLILLCFTLIFFGFVQAYYLALALTFLVFTSIFYLIYKSRVPALRTRVIGLIIAYLLPLGLYFLWVNLSGALEITDRPYRPYGFYDYVSSFRDVFLPVEGRITDLINVFFPIRDVHWEGYGFVGLAAIISTLAGVWVLRDRIYEKEFLAPSLGVYLMAALGCLLIALCIPFKFLPESWIPNIIFQFRTLGRFVWIFYFVFSATSIWLLYILSEYLRKKSHSVIAMVFLLGMIFLWTFEGLSLQKSQVHEIKSNGKLTNDYLSFENSYSKKLKEIGQKPESFQAVLAFPYFNIGSEEFFIERDKRTLYEASKIALDMQLPIAQNYLNRASISQTINLIQLMSHPLIPKKVLGDMKDDRSLLLVTVGDQFEEDELRLLKKSRLLIKNGDVSLYDLPLNAFQHQVPNIDSLKAVNGVRKLGRLEVSSRKDQNILWKNFEKIELNNKRHLLSQFELKEIANNEAIEVSLWVNISQSHAAFPILYVDVLNSSQQVIQSYECNPAYSTDVIQQQVRAQIIVPYSEQNHALKVRMDGKDQSLNTLLIRPMLQNVWIKEEDGREFLNNYPLGLTTTDIH